MREGKKTRKSKGHRVFPYLDNVEVAYIYGTKRRCSGMLPESVVAIVPSFGHDDNPWLHSLVSWRAFIEDFFSGYILHIYSNDEKHLPS